ncbi:hypothetical protein QN277_003581 [Acacia crassicarpa]|uniref:Uncharacterized protein n=1 Tax=Acacia crassicarpa TaxID=499986 RepID=A0AAE1J0P6_9FABA|nr:hypothetical protein QN277_003581 [Acacia crassicarpa]
MQRGRGGQDPFSDLGSPFGDFGSPFGGFGSFGPPGSLMSNFFGGRNPFDDPFFTRPFGGMFESSIFGTPRDFFPDMHPSGYIEHQAQESRNSRGPIIEELDSAGDEKEVSEQGKEKRARNSQSNNEPHVMHPDDEVEGNRRHQLQSINDFNRFSEFGSQPQPQAHSFCFQSSTVSYGGPDGAYYTSSRTRRSGSDGVTFEEDKEANSATREATHRVSRGLRNKGHSLTRKLNSDGKVDSMQTLHNLNEDELSGFEEAWQGKAQKYLPGWAGNAGASGSRQIKHGSQGGWALPSVEDANRMGTMPEFRDQARSSVTKDRTRTSKSDRSTNHRRARG